MAVNKFSATNEELDFAKHVLGTEQQDVEVAPQESTTLQQVDRMLARGITRGSETLLGLPGTVVQQVRSLAQALPSGIVPEEELNFAQKAVRNLVEGLPSIEELRARSAEKLPQFEPESTGEEIQDELITDVASLAHPLLGGMGLLKSIGAAALGQSGKQAIKAAGGGPIAQEITKLGGMVFTGLFGAGRGVNTHINRLYQQANRFLPAGARVPYPTNRLTTIAQELGTGAMNTAKTEAAGLIGEINAKLVNGEMTMQEAIQFDRDINRSLRGAHNDPAKRRYLLQIHNAHQEALGRYAAQNPTWGAFYNEAKQAYAGIATSANVQNFIRRNTNLKNLSHAGLLLGLEETFVPGSPMAKLAVTGVLGTGTYIAELGRRITTNPALRRYYQNVIQASLTENRAMLARNLSGLERAAKEEFEKHPLPEYDVDNLPDETDAAISTDNQVPGIPINTQKSSTR